MKIRKFKQGEEKELYEIFYNTIRTVNIQDYSEDQVAAWAPSYIDMEFVMQKIRDIDPFVAVEDGRIIGYADIQPDGYIDHFYCHHQFQGQGVGRRLFVALEEEAVEKGIPSMYSNVSITAKPFFKAMGFSVEREQLVKVGDQQLKNYRMVRRL
ncbi:GNAT family N-acetyltransferase [Halomonas salipaludis]|uniref:GNAT family N-acetyltransferase n=1 Tax=Halomonas salipaludis TaxID=2032625 RepID=A0A2A2F2B8_9GAMM|nr:GNAT family N-acetyltransferase [Halomonas salipaludis]PAU78854.1 GNAT family N-acetyltransferase [Halomonas salipaludis]